MDRLRDHKLLTEYISCVKSRYL